MKNSFLKNTINIILIVLIISSAYSLTKSGNIKIETNYTSEYIVGETLKLEIETFQGYQIIEPQTLKISIYNKYNKSETIDAVITPYAPGKYMIMINPQYSGDYIVNISLEYNGQTATLEEIFTIK